MVPHTRYVGGYATASLHGQTLTGGKDIFVIKFSADGTRLWTRLFGSTGDDVVASMALDVFGNVLLAGSVSASTAISFYGTTLSGTSDGFVLRCGPDGTRDWSNLLGSAFVDRAESVAADAAGNAVVAGITDGQVTSPHVFHQV